MQGGRDTLLYKVIEAELVIRQYLSRRLKNIQEQAMWLSGYRALQERGLQNCKNSEVGICFGYSRKKKETCM